MLDLRLDGAPVHERDRDVDLVLAHGLIRRRRDQRTERGDGRVRDALVAELRVVACAVDQGGGGAVLERELALQPPARLWAVHQLEHQRVHARMDRRDLLRAQPVLVAELDDGVLDRVRDDAVRIGLEPVVRELPPLAEPAEQLLLAVAGGREHGPEAAPPAQDVVGRREARLGELRRLEAVGGSLRRVHGLRVAAEDLAHAPGLRPGHAEGMRHLLRAQPQQAPRAGRGAEGAGGARDVPSGVVVPRVDRHRHAAGGLGAQHEGRAGLAPRGPRVLGGCEHRRPYRGRGVQHRGEVRVVVVLEVRQVAVEQRGGGRRGPQARADDARAGRSGLGGCPLEHDAGRGHDGGRERDAEQVDERPLGLMKRPAGQAAGLGAHEVAGEGRGRRHGDLRASDGVGGGREYSAPTARTDVA